MPQSKKDTKTFEEVEDMFTQSQRKLHSRFKMYNQFEDLFLGYIENAQKYGWKSRVTLPFAYQQVMQFVSHQFNSLPRGKFMAREHSDEVDVFLMNEVVKYQIQDPKQDFLTKLKRNGIDMGQYGTSFGVLHWRNELRGKDMIWDDPFYQPLYIYDCFPDPSAVDIQDMQYFIHNEYVSLEDLKATNAKGNGMARRYKNLGLLEELVKDPRKAQPTVDSRRGRVDKIRKLDRAQDQVGRILIRRGYLRTPDGTRFISWAPDYSLIIEDRVGYEHKDLPVHILRNTVYPNQLYGIGEIEPVLSIHNAAQNLVNQHMDMTRIAMYQMFKVKRSGLKNVHTWTMGPGAKWVVDQMDDIQEIKIPDTTSATFQNAYNLFRDEINRSSGAFDVITRQESTVDRTATEVAQAGEEQNARRRDKESNVDTFIARLLTQWAQLNQEFITSKKVIRIAGEEAINLLSSRYPYEEKQGFSFNEKKQDLDTVPLEGSVVDENYEPIFRLGDGGDHGFLKISRDDIVGVPFDFIVESGSTIAPNQKEETRMLTESLGLLQKVEPSLNKEGVNINYKPVIDRILRGGGMKNLDEIFESQEEQMVQEEGSPMGIDPMAAMQEPGMEQGLPPELMQQMQGAMMQPGMSDPGMEQLAPPQMSPFIG